MVPFRVKRPTGVIDHPGNDRIKPGELKVVVERPSRAQRELFANTLAQYEKVQPAIDPVSGKLFRDSTGQAIALKVPVRYPLQPTLEFLQEFVKDIVGFGDGVKPVKFTPENAIEMIRGLMEEDLDFRAKRAVPVFDANGEPTGQTEEKEVDISFMQHVLERLNEKETYADPSPATSSQSSSNDS